MTSPIEDIPVECPKCWHLYQDWFRASVNLDLDAFDEEYLDQCSSATCPECQHKVKRGAGLCSYYSSPVGFLS